MRAGRLLVGSLLLALVSGCSNDFAPPSEVHGLRVLAVRQDPASGRPGTSVGLDMLLADPLPLRTDRDGNPHPPDVGWVGGCNNPPSRQYFACEPGLRQLGADPEGAIAAGLLGSGMHYDLPIPDDILSSAPKQARDPVHFGVSYAFFAACTGWLKPASAPGAKFPFECLDEHDAPIGASGFVIGFSTVYSYEGEENQNHNPSLSELAFDGTRPPLASIDALSGDAEPSSLPPCTTDVDCADLASARPLRCSNNGVCAPVVPACGGKGCPRYRVTPELDPASVETMSGGFEIQWASYYTTLGSFGSDTRLVVDRTSGPVADISDGWKPPAPDPNGSPRTSRIWVTVNDQRGGATWAYFDVVVE